MVTSHHFNKSYFRITIQLHYYTTVVVLWYGVVWCGMLWCGVVWSLKVKVWCGVVLCVLCGVWCAVLWLCCTTAQHGTPYHTSPHHITAHHTTPHHTPQLNIVPKSFNTNVKMLFSSVLMWGLRSDFY